MNKKETKEFILNIRRNCVCPKCGAYTHNIYYWNWTEKIIAPEIFMYFKCDECEQAWVVTYEAINVEEVK